MNVHTFFLGICVTYNDSHFIVHGRNDYDDETFNFTFAPDERITSVYANCSSMIKSLKFTTSKATVYGPYVSTFTPPVLLNRPVVLTAAPATSAYLSYIQGTVNIVENLLAIRNLRFTWAYNKTDKTCALRAYGERYCGITIDDIIREINQGPFNDMNDDDDDQEEDDDHGFNYEHDYEDSDSDYDYDNY